VVVFSKTTTVAGPASETGQCGNRSPPWHRHREKCYCSKATI